MRPKMKRPLTEHLKIERALAEVSQFLDESDQFLRKVETEAEARGDKRELAEARKAHKMLERLMRKIRKLRARVH